MSLAIVTIAVTLNPNPFLYDWLKRELMSLFAVPRRRNGQHIALKVQPRRIARAIWLYFRFKWKTAPGRTDLIMFSVAVSAVTGVWDKVALKGLELLEQYLKAKGVIS